MIVDGPLASLWGEEKMLEEGGVAYLCGYVVHVLG